MRPHGLAAAHGFVALDLNGRHGSEFVLERLLHLRAKALKDFALDLHEPRDPGRQDWPWGWWRDDTRLRTVVRNLIALDPGDVERSSGSIEAAHQMGVVVTPKGTPATAGGDD